MKKEKEHDCSLGMVEEVYCRLCGKEQLEAGISGRVQSGYEQSHVRRGVRGRKSSERKTRCSIQEAQRCRGQLTKMVGPHREEQPSSLSWRVQGRKQNIPDIPCNRQRQRAQVQVSTTLICKQAPQQSVPVCNLTSSTSKLRAEINKQKQREQYKELIKQRVGSFRKPIKSTCP